MLLRKLLLGLKFRQIKLVELFNISILLLINNINNVNKVRKWFIENQLLRIELLPVDEPIEVRLLAMVDKIVEYLLEIFSGRVEEIIMQCLIQQFGNSGTLRGSWIKLLLSLLEEVNSNFLIKKVNGHHS